MKHIALALLATAGLAATTAARADHVNIRGSINVGGPAYVAPAPGYYAPAYAPPARGYWRDVTVPVWVPGRWVMTRDGWGRHVRVWEAPHREYRTERVWVDAYAGGREHHEHGYDRDRGYGYGPRWNG